MSNRVFTWCQDVDGNTQAVEFNKLSSDFGDGYSQQISVGINSKHSTWQFKRTAEKNVIIEIKNFLDDHKTTNSFLWDSPFDGRVRVRSEPYSLVNLGGNAWSISTTFIQSFGVN